jgi:hypothetical protein
VAEIADIEARPSGPDEGRLDSAVARLPRWMWGVAILSVLSALGAGRPRFAAGFAVGSAAAILAYHWLHRAVAAALDSTEARPARTLMVKFAMRYPLLVLTVILCYQAGWLSVRGVVAGLFVPATGALIEGVILGGSILMAGKGAELVRTQR